MAKVSVRTRQSAKPCGLPSGLSGAGEALCYFSGAHDPIHFHVVSLAPGSTVLFEPAGHDRLAYVWEGEADAGGRRLETGSSMIIEHGASLPVVAGQAAARMAVYSVAAAREGGQTHLLPAELVPRVEGNPASGTVGGLHANGNCPGCALWLNENSLAGQAEASPPEIARKGIHAHPENEVIFVTEGRMRLGQRLFDRGTALAIAADTLYGFTPGPEGVSFITFRPSGTTDIRFAAGGDYAPSTFFDSAGPIPYQEPVTR